MIHFYVAMPSEARPLLRHFDLRRPRGSGRPAIYSNSELALVVGGIGPEPTERACKALAAYTGAGRKGWWINIGIAGHRSVPLGTLIVATSVEDRETGERWELDARAGHDLSSAAVLTVPTPETRYPGNALYDMEASAFCRAMAGRVPVSRLVVAKVVSDNRDSHIDRLGAVEVERLVEGCLEILSLLIEELEG